MLMYLPFEVLIFVLFHCTLTANNHSSNESQMINQSSTCSSSKWIL